jgi:hypothetical protein
MAPRRDLHRRLLERHFADLRAVWRQNLAGDDPPETSQAREPGAEHLAGSADIEAIDMAWEVVRAVLQGLALWWYEHRHVPRAQVVAVAMNTFWVGFERASRGEVWQP